MHPNLFRLAGPFFLLATLLSAPAGATSPEAPGGLDAHGFQLAAFDGDLRDGLVLLRPGEIHHKSWFVGGLFEYADQPLVWVTVDEDGAETPAAVLDNVLALNLSAGVGLGDHVRLDAAFPFFLASKGRNGQGQGPAPGDLRLTALTLLVNPVNSGGFGLGLAPYLDVPTGDKWKFLGQDGWVGGALFNGTYEWTHLTLTGEIGAQLQPAVNVQNLKGADRLVTGIGLGWKQSERLGFSLEAKMSPPFQKNEVSGTDLPAEALLSMRGRAESGAYWTAGLASALSSGAGAARYRFFIGGGFGKLDPKPRDTDLDGLPDKLDTCPEQAEVQNGYQDEDGCPDSLARLSVEVVRDGVPAASQLQLKGAGAAQSFETTTAPVVLQDLMPGESWAAHAIAPPCLVADLDRVLVPGDNSVTLSLARTAPARLHIEVTGPDGLPLPGVLVRFESSNPECIPQGRRALGTEGLADIEVGAGKHTVTLLHPDYLPKQVSLELESGGAQDILVTLEPSRAQVREESIVILDKVYFENNKDIIKPVSYPLLQQVVSVLAAYPELKRVEVAGHTDSKGSDVYNLDLSDRRAKAVRTWLIANGVAPERLDARGYGETKPLDSNDTEDGRATNRRVEFNIIEKEETK